MFERMDKNRETALTLKNRNCEFLYLLFLLFFIAQKFFINKKSLGVGDLAQW
ncbi:rCG48154 [Rattus norvegicus]|uniref:RCG48154 n=1 Tax=Rattus norvegicus TaxID=10116 RepID=A6HZZ9_RAT|nr:rCG48154 [Rattus norvegicus]